MPDLARFKPPGAAPSKESVDEAVALLQGAQRPLIMFGARLGSGRSAAAHRARRAAGRLRAHRSQARRHVPERSSGALHAPFNVLPSRRASWCARPTSSWRSTG